MGDLIVYMKNCVKCADRQLWNKLRRYANKRGLAIEERRTGLSKEWREEASRYGIAQPFVVANGEVKTFSDFVKDLEEK